MLNKIYNLPFCVFQSRYFQTRMNVETISKKCEICFGIFDIHLCVCVCDHISHVSCKTCFTQYLEHMISNATLGVCPIIACPFSHKKRYILQYDVWSLFVSPAALGKYNRLAKSLLSILCSKCHRFDNLMVDFESNIHSDIINSFSCGKISVNEFYDTFDFSHSLHSILKAISNPERRATFHLRFLRDNPSIITTCCNIEHCFQCRTTHHEVCEINELDNTIVLCPDCSIRLTKGDGCNHVSCVCGSSFDWEKEKDLLNKCHIFEIEYPNTSEKCVEILCSENSEYAKAWYLKHVNIMNKKLYKWFNTFPFPSKVCANLLSETNIYGIEIAVKLWYQKHAREVDKYILLNKQSVRSIFETFFPTIQEKSVAIQRKITFSDDKINESMNRWIEENPPILVDIPNALSFLYLYGKNAISYQQKWYVQKSNPFLIFTNQNTTVERKGDVSCYPAAFIDTKSKISIRLDHFPKSNNKFSFGITTHLNHSYSDDVGKSINTWGIISSTNTSSIQANGIRVGYFRSLKTGDVLSFDFIQGWFELSVNGELLHRFLISIPKKYFTVILANDNKVTLLSETEIHPEHTYLYNSFIKMDTDIIFENPKIDEFIKPYPKNSWGEKFVHLYHEYQKCTLEKKNIEIKRANSFYESFGEDACFIAATRLQYQSNIDAISFMNVFKEKQNDWYLNHCQIENIALNCKCLPRHLNHCPFC